jgi:large subunit ribosomal protein L37Ae
MARRLGLGGGFGARYGTIVRRQHIEILSGLRSKHECPQCKFQTVKRWSVGVWLCKKCGYKFAGGAYTPITKVGEIAARATRGTMSPSTLSTELDSLRAGAKVAPSVAPISKRPRTRRKKPVEQAEPSVEEEPTQPKEVEAAEKESVDEAETVEPNDTD